MMAKIGIAMLLLAACTAPGVGVGHHSSNSRSKDKNAREAPATPAISPAPDAEEDEPFPQDTKELEDFFLAQMSAAQIPGMGVALVKDGGIRWARGYGFAELSSRSVTKDTVFRIASISKTVVAAALMHLIEDPAQKLSLDQDVQTKLPFPVRNPNFAGTPITFRMLLTHTSSIIDGPGDFSDVFGSDAPTPLSTWVQTYLARSDSWGNYAPGSKYSYSNAAASLAGHLVEAISGMNLQEYCRKFLFTPLEMNETSWFLRDLERKNLAVLYESVGGKPTALEPYGEAFYPAGQLRTSASQLARFLGMMTGKGRFGTTRVLAEATVDEMLRPQVPTIDPGMLIIFHNYKEPKLGHLFAGHGGAYRGCSSDMWFDLDSGAGYLFLTNSDVYMRANKGDTAGAAAMRAINVKLTDLAMALQ
jgi:CubicO group peptidase (beta-lactamase class C family)